MAPLTLLTPVLTHLKSLPSGRPPPVIFAVCFIPASAKPFETAEAIAENARSRLDVAQGVVLDSLFGEGRNAAQLRIDRPAVTRFDGDHERGLVGRSAP